jgi:hypothetical protein
MLAGLLGDLGMTELAARVESMVIKDVGSDAKVLTELRERMSTSPTIRAKMPK